MERKNTVLLTVIAVATLLVAVVGATFAYFTATASGGATGGEETATNTAKVSGVNMTSSPEIVTNHEKIYPGVWLATGVGVKAVYAEEHTVNSKVTFTLNGTIDLSALKGSSSEFTYNIYRSSTSVNQPVISCVTHESSGSNTGSNPEMYVSDCAIASSLGEGLLGSDKKLDFSEQEDGIFTITLDGQELNVEENAGAQGTHYYLVLKYKNEQSNQTTTDSGKDIKLQLTGVTNTNVSIVQ